jgi:hypothetical protein
MARRREPVAQPVSLPLRELRDRRHAAEELVVVSDLLDAIRSDTPAVQHTLEKWADVGGTVRAAK